MTGQEIIDHFDFLIDDSIDSDRALILANQAYDRLMNKRAWNFLKKADTSQTLASNTKSYAMPTDQIFPVALRFYNSTSDKYSGDYKPVAFKERRKYYKVDGFYFIDHLNGNIVFTANPSTEWIGSTIEQDYTHQPDQLTTGTSPIFNRSFHPIIAFEMARFFWYNEQDEKNRAYDREFQEEYREMFFDMVNWDNRLEYASDPDFMPSDDWTGGLQ